MSLRRPVVSRAKVFASNPSTTAELPRHHVGPVMGRRRLVAVTAGLAVLAAVPLAAGPSLRVASGFASSTLCSGAFVSGLNPDRVYADAGGLIFYGPDITDNFRRAAGYVDRILKGSKTSYLPVQQPTKFELIINATIAKAIGVTLPTTLLLRADEVIE